MRLMGAARGQGRGQDLEATLVDVGTLLVRLGKYRLATQPAAGALRAEAAEAGAAARRLHRQGTLESPAADSLLIRVERIREDLTRLLTTIRDSQDYQAAITAHRQGDAAALTALWPRIFEGVEPGPPPTVAYHPIAWQQRGRPRPPADIAAWVCSQLRDGLEAVGDDLDPATDPLLPVVSLTVHWPDGAPLALRYSGLDLPPPLLHRPEVGEVLLPRTRLRAPALVELAHQSMAVDEWAGDLATFHAAVAPILTASGLVVVAGTMPAAPD
jgi:hypothetical protein